MPNELVCIFAGAVCMGLLVQACSTSCVRASRPAGMPLGQSANVVGRHGNGLIQASVEMEENSAILLLAYHVAAAGVQATE